MRKINFEGIGCWLFLGMVICIDFDGTCVSHEYPEVGKDIGSVPVLRLLVDSGHRLVLFTMRSGEGLEAAVKWFEENGIELYGVNKNPTQGEWTQSPKAYGQMYIDDAALGCPIKRDAEVSARPFVNWVVVEEMLRLGEIIPR